MGIGALWTQCTIAFSTDSGEQQRLVRQRRDTSVHRSPPTRPPVENSWIGMRMEAPRSTRPGRRAYGAWARARSPIGEAGPALRRAVEQVGEGRVALLDVRRASR